MIIREKLTEEREQLVSELVYYCSKEDRIIAYFLGGSLAKKNADEFSDIDFRIVLNADELKSAVLDALAKTFRQTIAFIESQRSFYAVIHFSNFVKLDIFAYYPEEIVPSLWLKDIVILQDTKDLLETAKTASSTIQYTLTQSDMCDYLSKYTAYLHEFYRRQFRQESNYCEHCTLMMKHIIISLWKGQEGHLPNDLGDWSKYEGDRSTLNSRQKQFMKNLTPINSHDVERSLHLMNKELLDTARDIVEGNNFQIEIDKYDSLLNVSFR
ncbi:nucleotidyltransferase domain-containing protein [Alkalibacterium olivapovliticus]|uniref:Nucleotidyltransferase-like protein n=1 Tax=Alkalibacterium olivapovliticus TaxID=99907 RepID=A0A2T0VWE8_9LACT|nr:nucleotidyltransferase domain-containing protein [Alkalibacterium olivapovliticus]PRY76195.1 nucleotidyltransferase-like protein [Alkalibacterium olivapovliticus]